MDEQNFRKKFGEKRRIFFRREDDSEGGQASGSSPKKGGADSFVLNGYEHQKMGANFYKGLAAIFLGIIGSAFFLGYKLSSYSRDEIAKVVLDVVPNVRMDQDGPTIRAKFQTYDNNIIIYENKFNSIDQKFQNLDVFQRFEQAPSKGGKGKR